MKKTILILSTILMLSCQSQKNEKTDINKESLSNLDKELDSLYKMGVFNGFAASIVDSTGIVYNKGFGYADLRIKKEYSANTLINIASISKVFIGIALLKAQEMNFLELDDPINDYLPFKVINPKFPKKPISIRQLATHTSSIVDSDTYMESCYINKDDIPLEDALKEKYKLYYQNPSYEWMPLDVYLSSLLEKDSTFYDSTTFSNNSPGRVYSYSNIAAALCALVIESAAHMPFYEFTDKHIFQTLGMSSTNWLFEEVDSSMYTKLYFENLELPYYKILSYPDGGLITSSTDLSKFLIELIKGYSGTGTILNSSSYVELFKSQLENSAFEGKKNFNVGIFLEKELAYNVIGHTGGDPGTNTMMFFNTKTKKGRIFIANTDSDKDTSGEVFWGIWDALNI